MVSAAFILSPLFGTPLPSLTSIYTLRLTLSFLFSETWHGHHLLQEAFPWLSSIPSLAWVTLLML